MTPEEIITNVCQKYGLTELEVLSRRRQHRLMACRVEIAQALRALPGEPSYSQIGEWMGGRDHTSVLYYLGGKERKASRLKSNPRGVGSSVVSGGDFSSIRVGPSHSSTQGNEKPEEEVLCYNHYMD